MGCEGDAEGARKVAGAEVSVWRINDPVFGDDADKFDEGLLEAPIATKEALLEADGIILGAPGRQAGMCGEMRLFLDSLADMQTTRVAGGRLDPLRGKVGGAFTAVGGHSRGFGGHEAILQAFHATFLQHGMLVAGVPPSPLMDSSPLASTFGTVMGGPGGDSQALDQYEVRLAYSQGEWIAQIAKQLHDRDL